MELKAYVAATRSIKWRANLRFESYTLKNQCRLVDSICERDCTKVAATTQKRMRLKQGCLSAERELLSAQSHRLL
jgi:hypothetical protein